jgi:PAS domain S-box-containing protein
MRQRADVWHGATVALSMAGITLLACLARDQSSLIYYLCRYLYILPIMGAVYFFDSTTARFVALTCTGLFVPALVRLVYWSGLSSAVVELAALLFFYNLFASLGSSLIEFDRRQRKVVDTAQRFGELIGKSLDMGSVVPHVLEQGAQLCEADGVQIVLRQIGGHGLGAWAGERLSAGSHRQSFWDGQPLIADDSGDSKGATCRENLAQWLLRRNEVVVIPDLANDARFDFPRRGNRGPTPLMAAPLLPAPQPVGLLAMWRCGRRRFNADERDLLRVLADRSQSALENAWLYSQTDEALSSKALELSALARDLSILVDTSRAVSATLDLSDLLRIFCRKMIESVEATYCRIYLIDHEGQNLVLRAACTVRDFDRSPGIGRYFPVASLPWLETADAKVAPVVVGASGAKVELSEIEESLALPVQTRSLVTVPLAVKGRTLGIVVIGEMRSWDRSPFTEAKLELCQAIAGQGALAIENILAFESMARQSQRIQLVMDNVADGVFSTGLDRRILAFNPAAENITGYAARDVVGRRCSDVLRAVSDDGSKLCSTDCPVMLATQPGGRVGSVRCKAWITRSDGRKVLVSHSAAPLMERSGRIGGAVSVIRDVSREEELVRLRSEFISLVSHQLRTPLASISASAELLARGDLDRSAGDELLDTLSRQCLRLTRLVEQVLEASRLDEGRLKPVLEPLAPAPLIEGTVAMFKARYPQYTFRIQIPESLRFVMGDRVSTEVVLDNLLQNAVNYSPKGSRIDVFCRDSDSRVIIGVADQGMGIPADELDKVFERFHRHPGRSSGGRDGFGLGLYIARTLVEAQGGEIWVESVAAKGSCFSFSMNKMADLGDAEDTYR